jgi:plastocyanin
MHGPGSEDVRARRPLNAAPRRAVPWARGWLRLAGPFPALLAAFALHAAHAAPVEVQVSDDSGRPLAGAVVFLESPEAREAARPLPQVEVTQVERQFQPQVSVVTVGTSVSFPNLDTVRHHVYSFSATKKFEIKLYVGTPTAPVVFDRTGIAVLGCNIHDTMVAWVVVVDTPWFGRTGADGRARLPQVPAGSYRLRTWHPSLVAGAPAADQSLRVEAVAAQAVVKLAGARP